MSAASVAKIYKRLEKLKTTSRGVGKAGGDVHKAASGSVRSITNIIKGGTLGAVGTSLLTGPDVQQQTNFAAPFSVDYTNQASRVIEDPIIDVPNIVAAVESEEIDQTLPEAPEKIDLTTTEEIPVVAEVDPKIVVENYFNNELKPIPIEASLPASVSFSAESPEFQALQTDVQKLNGLLNTIGVRMNTVEEAIESAVLQNQKTLRDNERRRDESDVEERPQPQQQQKQPGALSKAGDFIGAALGAQLARYTLPAIALLGASLASSAESAFEDDSEEALVEEMDTIDSMHENYVKATVGVMAAKSTGALKTIAVGSAIGISQLNEKVPNVKTAVSAPMKRATQAIVTKSAPVTTAVNSALKSIKDIRPNPVMTKVVAGLKALSQFITSFAKSVATPLLSSASRLLTPVADVAGKVLKSVLAKPVNWYVGIEALFLAISMGDAYLINPSPEAEKAFHKETKTAINKLIDIMGGTYIATMIGVAIGGSLGTLVLPVFGTVAGTIIGAIFGIMLGETVFQILPIDSIVNATYDYFIRGDKTAFNSLGNKMLNHVKKELAGYADSLIETVDIVTGGGIELATTEDILSEYGDLTPVKLLDQAMSGVGTDENAIAYAFKDIKTEAQRVAINEAYKAETGLDLDVQLKSELSSSEYTKLEQQISKQLQRPVRSVQINNIETDIVESNIVPAEVAPNQQSLVQPVRTDATVTSLTKPNITTSGNILEVMTAPQGVVVPPAQETEQIISNILNESTVVQEKIVDNMNVTNINTATIRSIPDIRMATVEQKAGEGAIIPIIVQPKISQQQFQNPLGSTSGQSQIDTARSGYRTSDEFLSNSSLQT
jgi:hypothetical protein